MEVRVSAHDGVIIVAPQGRMDAVTAASLEKTLQTQIAQGNVRLVVDLSQVEYVSSAGVHALVGAMREARQHGGDVRIAGTRPEVHRVFALSGLTTIAEFFADIDSAAASFSR